MVIILFKALGTTMEIFFLTLLFSLPLALLVAMMRMSKYKIISLPTRLYQLIMRGTPLMLQIMLIYYGPFYLLNNYVEKLYWDRFTAAIVAFSINYAAYFAEIFRGGIQSIDRGQYDAGKVLGLTRTQTFIRIILPQVVKRILPACSNEFMTLVKDTALAFTIANIELLAQTKSIAAREFSIVPFLVAGLFYLIINTVVEQCFNLAERSLSYYQ